MSLTVVKERNATDVKSQKNLIKNDTEKIKSLTKSDVGAAKKLENLEDNFISILNIYKKSVMTFNFYFINFIFNFIFIYLLSAMLVNKCYRISNPLFHRTP
jgi:hypothetical protein